MLLEGQTIAVLGAGNMGGALVRGLVRASLVTPDRLIATGHDEERLSQLAQETGVEVTRSNRDAVREAEVVVLCTKPQAVSEVAGEIFGRIDNQALLISIAAGLTTRHLARLFGEQLKIVRAMPNIPAQVDEAATAIAPGEHADEPSLARAEAIFGAVGSVVRVPERLMDAVTGLSGSGPAYIYMVIEALTDGGVQMGLPRDTALRLATQTVLGSARLVKETGLHPAILRDQVTTPGGTTISAIHELERHGLRAMLAAAVVTATERSKALNGEEDSNS